MHIHIPVAVVYYFYLMCIYLQYMISSNTIDTICLLTIFEAVLFLPLQVSIRGIVLLAMVQFSTAPVWEFSRYPWSADRKEKAQCLNFVNQMTKSGFGMHMKED